MKKAILLLAFLITFTKADILDLSQDFANTHNYDVRAYNCVAFSRDLRVQIINTFKGSEVLYRIRAVDCASGYWDYDSCYQYGRLHMFLLVNPGNYSERFYLEATNGQEITPDLYPFYNLKGGPVL